MKCEQCGEEFDEEEKMTPMAYPAVFCSKACQDEFLTFTNGP